MAPESDSPRSAGDVAARLATTGYLCDGDLATGRDLDRPEDLV